MAKRLVKTVYDNLEDNQNDINIVEESLSKLRKERVGLLQLKDEFEMKKLFEFTKESGLTIEEVIEQLSLSKKKSA